MLDVLKFIAKCIGELASMLFNVNVGNGLSLGLFMTIIFIFLPTSLIVFTFLKNLFIDGMAFNINEDSHKYKKGGK